MLVKVHLNKLILKTKFSISHGNYDYRDQLIVELIQDGCTGLGETIAIDYYGIYIDKLYEEAMEVAKKIQQNHWNVSPEQWYTFLCEWIPENKFLRAAFDTAYYDWYVRKHDLTITDLLQVPDEVVPASSITIGISESDTQITARLQESWSLFKVKISKEHNRYELLDRLVDQQRAFGIDANGALSVAEANSLIERYSGKGLVYVEQLCSEFTNDIEKPDSIPHLADESVTDIESMKALSPYCDGYVLKLTKSGGITPVMEMISWAKSNDKLLLAGCMTESSIGINHMYSLLPYFDFADLDGAFLLENDKAVCAAFRKSWWKLNTNGYFDIESCE